MFIIDTPHLINYINVYFNYMLTFRDCNKHHVEMVHKQSREETMGEDEDDLISDSYMDLKSNKDDEVLDSTSSSMDGRSKDGNKDQYGDVALDLVNAGIIDFHQRLHIRRNTQSEKWIKGLKRPLRFHSKVRATKRLQWKAKESNEGPNTMHQIPKGVHFCRRWKWKRWDENGSRCNTCQ